MDAKLLPPTSRRRLMAETEDDGAAGVANMGTGVILVIISLVIGLTVLPILTSAIADSQSDPNVTSTQSTLLGLVPTLVIVALVVAAVGFAVKGFGSAGGSGRSRKR